MRCPINQEGPLFYWRKDIFERCKIDEPKALEDIPAAAAAIKSCDANQGAWAARGIRGVTPYALAAFIYNLGGSFATPDGKPGLSQPNSVRGLEMYANLLKDYGPPGALNHTFTQVIELLGQGRVAMTHESSNEFANIVRFPNRAQDLGVKVLPPGTRDQNLQAGRDRLDAGGLGAFASGSRPRGCSCNGRPAARSRPSSCRQVSRRRAPACSKARSSTPGPRKCRSAAPGRTRLIEIGRTGTGVYQSPTDRVPEARDIIGGAMQAIVQGRATPIDAAQAADAELAKLQ